MNKCMRNISSHPQNVPDAHGHYIPQWNGVEVSIDTNNDGIIDSVVHSRTDGHTVHVSDSNHDGRMDLVMDYGSSMNPTVTAYLDSDGDGVFERVLQDTDGDGVWDVTMTDSDGDGAYDSCAEESTLL